MYAKSQNAEHHLRLLSFHRPPFLVLLFRRRLSFVLLCLRWFNPPSSAKRSAPSRLLSSCRRRHYSPLVFADDSWSLCFTMPSVFENGFSSLTLQLCHGGLTIFALVPSFFIRKLVTQVFSFINTTLFNSLLLRRECCTFSNGEYVKSGLAELEKWIVNANDEYAGTSWHELNYIRQAVGFLVIHQKRKKSLEEIRQDLCPALTVRQIYRISTMYWDDKYGTQSVSNEVVGEMREIVSKDNQSLTSNSFLLDDDMSIPFSAEDIDMAIPAVNTDDIELPAFLSEYPCAQFLVLHE